MSLYGSSCHCQAEHCQTLTVKQKETYGYLALIDLDDRCPIRTTRVHWVNVSVDEVADSIDLRHNLKVEVEEMSRSLRVA